MSSRILVVPSRGLIESAGRAIRANEHWSMLDDRARTLGFSHWSFTSVPVCAGPQPLGPTRVTTYPEAYVEECAGRCLYDANPGFAYAMKHADPAYYGTVRTYIPHTARVRSYLDLNQRFGVTRGVLLPLRDVLGTRSLVGLAFSGSERELEELWHDARDAVLGVAAGLNRAILREHLLEFAAGLLPTLTRRQRDVLRELAEGRSVGEAAERMRVSIHTADKHVAAARRVLHSATTAQAIAAAVRFRMLE
jgi:DNA-binding CsgD family transcriptional regulator